MRCQSKLYALVVILVCAISDISAKKFKWPSDVQKCKVTDETKCVARVLTELLHRSDELELDVPQIDPFAWDKVAIYRTRNRNAAVSFKLTNSNVTLLGLDKMQIVDLGGWDGDTDAASIEVKVSIPILSSVGSYKATVKFFSLPIIGQGNINITFVNMNMIARMDARRVERDGKRYLDIQDVKLDIGTSRMSMVFENSLGDPTINRALNQVINDSWKDIFFELKPDLDRNIVDVADQVLRPFLENIPYDEFFESK